MNDPAGVAESAGGSMRSRCLVAVLATVALLLAMAALTACRGDPATAPIGQSIAPAAPADRVGDWLGGPEQVSGKLRSGIVSWWRLTPSQPQADDRFELALRLEGARAADAAVSVAAGDGARLVDAGVPQRWLLRAGQPALITLHLTAPAGDSYLHVTTVQDGRSSVRSIRLALPAGLSGATPTRGDYAVDARGEPIVRMPGDK